MAFRLDRWAPALFVLVLVALAAVDVPRGIDGTTRNPWRECDVGAIARNFHLEGMNPLYPRIDWRGHGPGFVESEFPLYPWLVAVTYRAFGLREMNGRVLSLAAAVLTLLAFIALARRLLPTAGWIVAGAFFATSPLLVRIGTSVQPEPLMLLFYVAASWLFVWWLDDRSWLLLALAMASASLAILTKLPAANIGVFFALLLLRREGLTAAIRPRYWLAAAACLAPPAAWYAHAHGFWRDYGASLGLSNKFHWVDVQALAEPGYIIGLGRAELFHVWMPAGVLLAAAGLALRPGGRAVPVALSWCAALAFYYLVTIRTTSEAWAVYYHVVSIPPAGLLVGNAAVPLSDMARRIGWRGWGLLALPAAIGFSVLSAAIGRMADPVQGLSGAGIALVGTVVAAAALYLLARAARQRLLASPEAANRVQPLTRRAAMAGMVMLFPALLLSEAAEAGRQMRPSGHVERHACIRSFEPRIPKGALIAVSGGHCRDADGHKLAHNASYAFYWLNRKGVNVCVEEQSVDRLQALARDGFGYFVADTPRMRAVDGFEEEVRRRYPVLGECGDSALFLLDRDSSPAARPGPDRGTGN